MNDIVPTLFSKKATQTAALKDGKRIGGILWIATGGR
jgi:hypothetical protein